MPGHYQDLEAYFYAGLENYTYQVLEAIQPGLVNVLTITALDNPSVGGGAAAATTPPLTVTSSDNPSVATGAAAVTPNALSIPAQTNDPEIYVSAPVKSVYESSGSLETAVYATAGGTEQSAYATRQG